MGLASIRNKDLLPRIKRKLKSYAKLARTTEEGITVVSPAVLPLSSTWLSDTGTTSATAGLPIATRVTHRKASTCDSPTFTVREASRNTAFR